MNPLAHAKSHNRFITVAGPSKVFEVGVYSLENRRLPKVVVASRLCRDEGKMGVFKLSLKVNNKFFIADLDESQSFKK